jgi:hypothetical protein
MSETKQFNISQYLMAFRDDEGMGFPEGEKAYRSSFPLAKRIVCSDGFNLSVQATHGAYCTPRQNIGPWWEVEVGFPSAKPDLIMEYAEDSDRPTDTVYGYVPIELVQQLIEQHGGPDEETIAKAEGGAA